MRKIQDLFGEDLREYRDSAHEQIRQLRKEMDAALSALEEFAGDTAARGDDHEKELKHALKTLDAAAANDRLEADKGGDPRRFRGHSFEFRADAGAEPVRHGAIER